MTRGSPKGALHHEVWESLGGSDPDWAVLTDPARRHGGWTDHLDDFYASGRAEVAAILEALPSDARLGRAVDWGSGTGRLTFALLEHFEHVTAVDVSRSMLATLIARAEKTSIAGRVTATLVSDLRPGSDHDFALSLLVLQHLSCQAEAVAALRALVRCVRVGGYVVVEIPDRPLSLKARLQPRFQLYQLLRRLGISPRRLHERGLSGISMLCLTQDFVLGTAAAAGAEPAAAATVRSDGAHRYVRYLARRLR